MRTTTLLIAALSIFSVSDAVARATACTRPCYAAYNSCTPRQVEPRNRLSPHGDICLPGRHGFGLGLLFDALGAQQEAESCQYTDRPSRIFIRDNHQLPGRLL